jgi:hypothetical protein
MNDPQAPRPSALRRWLPLLLLVGALLAWFERSLPGRESFARHFGEDAVLRFVLGFLALALVVLLLEVHRLEASFRDLLAALMQFRRQLQDPAAGQQEVKRDAVTILIGALGSADLHVRQNALQHLRRLTGADHGYDAARWQQWVETNLPGGPPAQ